MIDQFRPFMTRAEVTKLRGLPARDRRRRRRDEGRRVDPVAAAKLGLVTECLPGSSSRSCTQFEPRWPGIDADMSDMLDRMDANLGNFAGVDALPPFPLFPWFFVLPGLFVAGRRGMGTARAPAGSFRACGADRRPGDRRRRRGRAGDLPDVLARARWAGEMIDDFRSLMTRQKVTTIQGYFITIGNGESELRSRALPAAALPPGSIARGRAVRERLAAHQPRDGARHRRHVRQRRQLRGGRRAPAVRAVPVVLRDTRCCSSSCSPALALATPSGAPVQPRSRADRRPIKCVGIQATKRTGRRASSR